MARSTLPLLLKCLGAVALTALATADAHAQPPVVDDEARLVREFLEGEPAAPTRTKTCQPAATGAKQSHRGRPGGITPPGAAPAPLPRGEFLPQVFVTCPLQGPGPRFPFAFFVPVTPADEVFASQTLSVIGAAHLAGKRLQITYDPEDTSGAQIGCSPRLCKRILAIHMIDAATPDR